MTKRTQKICAREASQIFGGSTLVFVDTKAAKAANEKYKADRREAEHKGWCDTNLSTRSKAKGEDFSNLEDG